MRTGSDSRSQTRHKRIFYHQTEDPFAVHILSENYVIRLTMQSYAFVKAEALRRRRWGIGLDWIGACFYIICVHIHEHGISPLVLFIVIDSEIHRF
jgi:hypothetical protein